MCSILELNLQPISLHSRAYVNYLLLQHDLWEIKFQISALADNITLIAVQTDYYLDTNKKDSYDFNRRFRNVSPSNLKSINIVWD